MTEPAEQSEELAEAAQPAEPTEPTEPAPEQPDAPQDPIVYLEPPRGYATAWVLAAFLVGGLIFDLLVGSGWAHILLWLLAFAIVVGADLLATRNARLRRSLIITDRQVRISTDVLERASIVGLAEPDVPTHRVLGRITGEGTPRGMKDLILQLVDDSTIIVPTRDPQRVIDVLHLRPSEDHAVRVMTTTDAKTASEIEERSLALFSVSGYPPLPEGPPADAAFHQLITMVAGDPAVGVAEVRVVDGRAHLSTLAVLPAHMRHGIGTSLLEGVCAWVREQGYTSMTLTTFAEVPWNGPFFAARGFVKAGKLSPGLEAIRAGERTVGLDKIGERVVMVRAPLGPVAE